MYIGNYVAKTQLRESVLSCTAFKYFDNIFPSFKNVLG